MSARVVSVLVHNRVCNRAENIRGRFALQTPACRGRSWAHSARTSSVSTLHIKMSGLAWARDALDVFLIAAQSAGSRNARYGSGTCKGEGGHPCTFPLRGRKGFFYLHHVALNTFANPQPVSAHDLAEAFCCVRTCCGFAGVLNFLIKFVFEFMIPLDFKLLFQHLMRAQCGAEVLRRLARFAFALLASR